MKAATFFNIEHGITAIIGGGGKTTLMYTLANELAEHGSVIVCTSAKIYRPDNCKIVDDNAESIAKAEMRSSWMDRCSILTLTTSYACSRRALIATPWLRPTMVNRAPLSCSCGTDKRASSHVARPTRI